MTQDRLLHWRGPDPDRVEAAFVSLGLDSLSGHGTSVTADYTLGYRLTTGPSWITQSLDVRVDGDGWWRLLRLRRNDDGTWDGARHDEGGRRGEAEDDEPFSLPDLDGALDCDLGLCPLTNTMPILRHDLVGAAHRNEPGTFEFLMAWVSVPDLAVRRSEQRYTVGDPVEPGGALIGYASTGFRTVLEVDADGLVVNYPGLARQITP